MIIELGKSCRNLENIDISLCKGLTEEAILSFLRDCRKLKKFTADHMETSITDATIEQLAKHKGLEKISINFCKQVTATGLEFLCEH